MATDHKPPCVAELANAHQYDASEHQPRTPAHFGNPFKNDRA
jgi:hypothetical protein